VATRIVSARPPTPADGCTATPDSSSSLNSNYSDMAYYQSSFMVLRKFHKTNYHMHTNNV